MQIIRENQPLSEDLRGGAVAIGNFDGVHRGHARIIERLRARANELQRAAIVFTFDPHPVRLLRPEETPPPLTWTDRKGELLQALGVDAMIAYPTDEQLLSLGPKEFFDCVLCGLLGARAVIEGPNFFFGKDRGGDINTMRELCKAGGLTLDVVEPYRLDDGGFVSSSRIRSLIGEGEVSEAHGLLTQPYRIRGMVTHGAARGAKIGFPTANIDAVDTLLPAHGVYAGRGHIDGETWTAAINIGPKPTFGDHAVDVEAHLLGYRGSLYGQPLEVDFLERLRDIQPFPDVESLKRQLTLDVNRAAEIAARHAGDAG